MAHDFHGGEIYGLEDGFVDFSVNINPLGFPENVWKEMLEHPELATLYPDQDCAKLRKALGKKLGIAPKNIICGNGASEIFSMIARGLKPEKALVTAPTFSGYEHALRQVGATIAYHRLMEQDQFALTETYIESLTDFKPNIAFLCQPNNPVGNLIDHDFLEKIMDICEQQETFLVLDICFLGFTHDDERWYYKKLSTHPHLILGSAFTKLYAMPGIRLGYMAMDNFYDFDDIVDQQTEWSVSGIAQWVGQRVLEESDYVEEGRKLVDEERAYLTDQLTRMGFTVFPSEANFILVKGDWRVADSLYKKEYLVRKAYNFKGLDNEYFRIAVKTHEENEELVWALQIIQADMITFQEIGRQGIDDMVAIREMHRDRFEMPEITDDIMGFGV
ncbi:MAG: aminotransferase class I/II-fold pyridoxal phosphate-dependent enzyme [Lachnospiraceae bacterium]|nr:aminotransferase class I/II-fold pyridoxal phosphate-dependent enzyme [Candidatus Equihabitans merdae]